MRINDLITEAKEAVENNDLKLAQTKIGHALILDQNNYEVLELQFLLLIETNKYNEAEDVLDELIEIDSQVLELLVFKAAILNDKGKIDEAIKLCELIISNNPDYYTAYSFKGMFNYNLGNLEESYRDLNYAVEKDRKSSIAYQNRGSVNLSNYQFEEALKDFNKAIKFDKNSTESKFNKAVTLRLLGKNKKAIKTIENIELNDTFDAEDLVQASIIYHKNDKTDKAKELLNMAINIDETFVRAHYTRFIINIKTEKFNEAEADLNNALQNDDGSFRNYLLNGYAHLYYKRNEFSEAIRRANVALNEFPDFHWINLTLAEIYGKLNDDQNFYKNLNLAIKGGIGLAGIDKNIRDKYSKNKEFKLLIKELKKNNHYG